jgi:hypothetical protein
MASSILVIVASYMMVKAVRDAVFLAKFGLTERALVSIGLALCAGFGTAALTKIGHGLPRERVILVLNTIVAGTLIVFRAALAAHLPGAATALYVWSSFFGLVIIANFWLLANEMYDARSAKRLFAMLGAGAILGGVVGGQLTEFLAPRIGALNLLPVIAGGLVLAAFLAAAAAHGRAPRSEALLAERPRMGDGFRLIQRDRHLKLIAALLLFSTVATTLIDYQVQSVVKRHFESDRDQMTAFFGRLTSLLSVASLAVQLFLTPRILRRIGVTTSLMVLPAAVFLGAAAIGVHVWLLIPALTAATLARVGDGGIRFSLDKASMELLYLPVADRVKAQAKPVIDTFVDRLGTALTGVAWIAITGLSSLLGADVVVAGAIATMCVVAVWAVAIAMTRRQYVQTLRAALPPAPAGLEPPLSAAGGAGGRTLAEELHVLQLHINALEHCAAAPSASVRLLARLLTRSIERDLERVFAILAAEYPRSDVAACWRGVHSDDPIVRAHAIELLDNLLDGDIKYPLLSALERHRSPVPRPTLAPTLLRQLAADDDPWLSSCAIHILEEAEGGEARDGGHGDHGHGRDGHSRTDGDRHP